MKKMLTFLGIFTICFHVNTMWAIELENVLLDIIHYTDNKSNKMPFTVDIILDNEVIHKEPLSDNSKFETGKYVLDPKEMIYALKDKKYIYNKRLVPLDNKVIKLGSKVSDPKKISIRFTDRYGHKITRSIIIDKYDGKMIPEKFLNSIQITIYTCNDKGLLDIEAVPMHM